MLEAGLPGLAKHLMTVVLANILTATCMRGPEPGQLSDAGLGFQTCPNCDVVNVYCLKPLGLGIIHYPVIDNYLNLCPEE